MFHELSPVDGLGPPSLNGPLPAFHDFRLSEPWPSDSRTWSCGEWLQAESSISKTSCSCFAFVGGAIFMERDTIVLRKAFRVSHPPDLPLPPAMASSNGLQCREGWTQKWGNPSWDPVAAFQVPTPAVVVVLLPESVEAYSV